MKQQDRVVVVVPCRTASSRFPAKALQEIHGLAAIDRCLLNACAIGAADAVVLATTNSSEDDELARHTLDERVEVVRGPVEDVLQRILEAVARQGADHVVRVTGDSPFVSFELADIMIEAHLASGADATCARREYAVGTGCDVYRVAALRRLRELRAETPYSEYLILYFKNNPHVFRVSEVEVPPEFRSSWRLTLDEPSDLDILRRVAEGLDAGFAPIPWAAVRAYLDEHPELALLNEKNQLRYVDDPILRAEIDHATRIAP